MEVLKYNIRNLSETDYNKWYNNLSPVKKQRVDRFRFADDKRRSVAGDMLIKSYINKTAGTPVEDIIMVYDANGKPYIKNSSIHFNISHSGNMVVCAVNDKPIGIDVENIRPINLKPALKVFNEKELKYLFPSGIPGHFEITDDEALIKRFFELWTLKEAFVKYSGIGITDNLKEIDVPRENTTTEFYDGYVIGTYCEKN